MKYVRRDNSVIEFTTILEDYDQASIFHHFKGHDYKIVTIARDSDNLEDVVVYRGEYDDNPCWCRRIDEFFSEMDQEKYPDVKQKYRFEKIK